MAQPESLDRLAEQINEEHRKVEVAVGKAQTAMSNALLHAKRAGRVLVEVKERTRHGEWGAWLEANFEGSGRRAQDYMRIHSRWSEIEANAQSSAHLSIDGALKAIRSPQENTLTREPIEGPLGWAGEVGEQPTEEDREPDTIKLIPIKVIHEGAEGSEDFSAWSSAERELLDAFRAGESIVVNMYDPGPHTKLVPWLKATNQLVKADRFKKWGNPFIMPYDGDRDTVVRNFEEHYLPNKPSLLNELPYMKGVAWGCWCAPQPCHCDVLKRVAEGGSSAEPKVEG
jgi:hypothetical protein